MNSTNYHKGKYYVTFKRGFEESKKDITITVNKIYESDCLKILLSDEEDPAFLCVLDVTRRDYDDLKKQQGLLIDFDNFPSQLVRLLQQSASNNMFLIMQLTNPVQYYFEIVEHNEFKRLVHLSLKTAPASDNDIKNHMSETVSLLKKTLATVKNSLSSSEALWSDKCINMERKIHDLTIIVSKMDEDKLRREKDIQEALKHERDKLIQEKQLWLRNNEANTKSQLTNMQEVITRKDKQIDEMTTAISQLKDSKSQLESQLSEKCQRMILLEKEVQKTHIELATTKAKNSALERDVMEKDKHYHQLSLKCSDLEKELRESSLNIREFNNNIQVLKNEKSALEERLSHAETLASKNNQAAHSSAEQLLKANQIISKQNADLIAMKEKMLCRTAIALEQEKVIETNAKEIEGLKTEINVAKQNVDKIKTEYENLKEKYDSNEKALKERDETIKNNNMVIQWLHKKMEETCAMSDGAPGRRPGAASSTPHAPGGALADSHTVSDESINFYATSKISSIEESPQVVHSKGRKVGLDPKYLQPSVEERQTRMSDRKGQPESSRGKENKNVNLPQVDYREKKSARGTFRSTPVSAYFP